MKNNPRIAIIGCGAGGGTAAQIARKTNRKATILLFEKDSYAQYSKCGLPYVFSGKIKQFSDLVEFSQDWFEKNNITLQLDTKVTHIDPKEKELTAQSKNTQTNHQYDSLILATGGIPTIPQIKGLYVRNQFINGVAPLRTIDDGKYIRTQLKKGAKVIVLGAGLIGLEAADTLLKRGLSVTIVEALPSLLGRSLDSDMASSLRKKIEQHATVFTNHLLTEVHHKKETLEGITLQDKESKQVKKLTADLLIIATGVRPQVELAESIGCTLGLHGGITINEKTETTVKNVYAIGDCTEYIDFVTGKSVPIGLGSIVVRQGMIAGVNAAGGNDLLPKGLLQTWTSQIFDTEIAGVGPLMFDASREVVSGKYTGSSLPHYYPGGKPITIKIKADQKNNRILSAQAVGDNAALRINTLACAILNTCTVDTFRKMETAYAPPVAPTLDPLTIAGDVTAFKLARKKRSK